MIHLAIGWILLLLALAFYGMGYMHAADKIKREHKAAYLKGAKDCLKLIVDALDRANKNKESSPPAGV